MADQLTQAALAYHRFPAPGKISVTPTKGMSNQRDLALAYSPGVAAPCLEIEKDPLRAYDYTAKGNLVAVISNGTAVLGLGNIGAVAGKPVMEGKGCLFKKFAGIDVFDIEIDETDPDKLIEIIASLEPTFGGINLEDIKAPECFVIETRLRERMKIPVFHDDQHGTAIVAAAALLNALEVVGKRIDQIKLVCSGAGAAAIACLNLAVGLGLRRENVWVTDSKGVVHAGRTEAMDPQKAQYAQVTEARTLAEIITGADVFFGLSAKGAVTKEMVAEMGPAPIIFAMANPDPEITPEEVREVRQDAIVATGRSDYANQVNNVLGFPYIFRGALDVRAKTINMEMKIAAAEALAALAREDVPDEVDRAYAGRRLRYGPEYIIPAPFDPRLIVEIPKAVALAAMRTKVARRPIEDMEAYEHQLMARLDPTSDSLQAIFEKVREHPRRVVFAEGEEEKTVRAAFAFAQAGYGEPILVGRQQRIAEITKGLGLNGDFAQVMNAGIANHRERYTEFLFNRLQRQGHLYRDCQRMVNQNRNVFAACMVATGEADALVTGLTRNFSRTYTDLLRALDAKPGWRPFGLSIVVARRRSLFVADTLVHEVPTPEELADIAVQAAAQARALGHEPRVALLSYSNFGDPQRERSVRVREAVKVLDSRRVDFEYDGEMQVQIALNYERMRELYPFCRLSGPANVLVMPALHSASIVTNILGELGFGTLIGPLLIGLSKPAQIVPLGATVQDMVTAAALASHDSIADSVL